MAVHLGSRRTAIVMREVAVLFRMIAPHAVPVRDVAVVPLHNLIADKYHRVGHIRKRHLAPTCEASPFLVKRRLIYHIIRRRFFPQRVQSPVNAGRRPSILIQPLLQDLHGLVLVEFHHMVQPAVEFDRLCVMTVQVGCVIQMNLVRIPNELKVFLAEHLTIVKLRQDGLVLLDYLLVADENTTEPYRYDGRQGPPKPIRWLPESPVQVYANYGC